MSGIHAKQAVRDPFFTSEKQRVMRAHAYGAGCGWLVNGVTSLTFIMLIIFHFIEVKRRRGF